MSKARKLIEESLSVDAKRTQGELLYFEGNSFRSDYGFLIESKIKVNDFDKEFIAHAANNLRRLAEMCKIYKAVLDRIEKGFSHDNCYDHVIEALARGEAIAIGSASEKGE